MSDPTDWFVRYQRSPANAPVRLFAFPFAGGGAAVYREWGDCLRGVDVHSLLLPGRERRLEEPPIGDARLLLDRMLPALLALADRPFILFGHSMGALIAYELAHRLREYNLCPLHLIVSAYRSPERPRRRVLHLLPDDEFMEALRGYDGTQPGILDDPELVQLLLPMIRSDFRLHESYEFTARDPLNCPMTAIVANADQHVSEEEMQDWCDKTDSAFSLVRVDGAHFYLLQQPDLVLPVVQRCIDGLAGR
jgi:medium-chain acyl-[acyl-carrier-protein] hydrolase